MKGQLAGALSNKKEQTNIWVFAVIYVNKESILILDSSVLIF